MDQDSISYYSMLAACVSALAAVVAIFWSKNSKPSHLQANAQVEFRLHKLGTSFEFVNEYLYLKIFNIGTRPVTINKIFLSFPLVSHFKQYDLSAFINNNFTLPHEIQSGDNMYSSFNAEITSKIFFMPTNRMSFLSLLFMRLYIVDASGNTISFPARNEVASYLYALQSKRGLPR